MATKWAIAFFVVLATTGCNALDSKQCGAPSADSCDAGAGCPPAPTSPCGGALSGSWVQNTSCTAAASCPTEQVAIGNWTEQVYTFRDDLTYSIDQAGTLQVHTTLPASCVTKVTDCAKFNVSTEVGTIACTGSPSVACICDGTANPFSTQGTYTVDTTQHTISYTESGGRTSIDGYCVQGTHLYRFFFGKEILGVYDRL